MNLDNIYQFFQDPPPTYLSQEQAVCYILSVLLQGESYATELIKCLESEYPCYRLSDTVLYNALKFLQSQKALAGYSQKVDGRGRPRRMYRVVPEYKFTARKLARLWEDSVAQKNLILAEQEQTFFYSGVL